MPEKSTSGLTLISKCRACDSEALTEFLDLGEQYLSDFRPDHNKTPKYPLVAVLCEDCKLVQLKHTTPPQEMYHDRYGFKSGISQSIKDDLQDNVNHALKYVRKPTYWLDQGSNDGTLLSLVPDLGGGWKVGIDPVTFLCDEAEQANPFAMIINDYFSREAVPFHDGTFDVITTISCFYDMPDPSKFVEETASLLSKQGVWIIQQNYLLTTMQLNAVDNFCHEHLEYYSLLSLENLLNRFGLEVNEVKLSTINGGSIRTVVSHKGTFPVDESVAHQRDEEWKAHLDEIEPYQIYAKNVLHELNKLRTLCEQWKFEGKSVCILAASTRGATIWQSAGIDSKLVDYAVERNPAKVGKMFTAIGIPIVSEEEFRYRKPDYTLVGPWFFEDEIKEREAQYLREGGHLVLPLPTVRVL